MAQLQKAFRVVKFQAQAIVGYFLLLRLFILEIECTASCPLTLTNSTSWSQLTNYPKLEQLLENTLSRGRLTDGSHSLMFENWKDETLRITCPEKDSSNDYKWKQYCPYGTDSTNKNTDECEKFNQQKYSGRNLIIKSPNRCGKEQKVYRTYSCETVSNNCKHYIHVFIRPLPLIDPPPNIPPGKAGSFNCKVFRCKNEGPNEGDSFSITWRGPDGNLILENGSLPYVIITHAENEESSTLAISNATDENVGNYECIITSLKYSISSVPSDFAVNDERNETCDVDVRSGVKNRGCTTVHSRPDWYVAIPIGIIGILFAILPILIKCLPTNEDEADIDNDDDEDEGRVQGPRQRLNRESSTGSGTGGNITLRSMTIVESEKNPKKER